MCNYNKLLAVLTILLIVVSLFTLSASAESVDTSSDMVSSVEDNVSSDVIDEEITDTGISDVELTNEYLKYITGILTVFLVIVLFYFSYKFFAMFF